jgi:hypothetical protein
MRHLKDSSNHPKPTQHMSLDMTTKMIDVIEGLMHVRGNLLESQDALETTKSLVGASGLPMECGLAVDSLSNEIGQIVKKINSHIMKIGHGVSIDDIRPILNYDSPEENTIK